MLRGIYLVDKLRTNVDKEVGALRSLPDIDIAPLYFEDIVTTVGGDGRILLVDGSRITPPDFVMVRAFRLDDSKAYHLKSVLRMLEGMGVLCINPPRCKDITADKLLTFQVAADVVPDVRAPKTMLVTPGIDAAVIGENLGYPVVLKVLHGEGGTGVTLVEDEGALKSVLKIMSAVPMRDQVIAQQAILSSKGRDLRIVVIGGRVVDAFVRSNPGGFTSNAHQGGHVEEFDPPDSVKDAAVRLADAMGMAMGSVDFLFGERDGEFYLCEANSSIGMPYLTDGSRGDVVPCYIDGIKRLLGMMR